MHRFGVFFAVLIGAGGCGTQSDSDIPPELLDAIAGRNSQQNYPSGAQGGSLGDVATNICFPAWDAPKTDAYDPQTMTTHCLSDYYDPQGGDHRLLFVVSSAIWCQSCQAEFGGAGTLNPLGQEITARHERGLRALGGLFQNAQGEPASVDDAVRWAQAFDVDFPFGADSDFVLGRFAKADAQPLHLLVDTQTMKIVYKATGGNITLLWQTVDEILP